VYRVYSKTQYDYFSNKLKDTPKTELVIPLRATTSAERNQNKERKELLETVMADLKDNLSLLSDQKFADLVKNPLDNANQMGKKAGENSMDLVILIPKANTADCEKADFKLEDLTASEKVILDMLFHRTGNSKLEDFVFTDKIEPRLTITVGQNTAERLLWSLSTSLYTFAKNYNAFSSLDRMDVARKLNHATHVVDIHSCFSSFRFTWKFCKGMDKGLEGDNDDNDDVDGDSDLTGIHDSKNSKQIGFKVDKHSKADVDRLRDFREMAAIMANLFSNQNQVVLLVTKGSNADDTPLVFSYAWELQTMINKNRQQAKGFVTSFFKKGK
jgi:hypothetical protein